VVGIVTRYGLDGPGIESWWEGGDFSLPFRLALALTHPPVRWVPASFPEAKLPERGVSWTTQSSNAGVKERV